MTLLLLPPPAVEVASVGPWTITGIVTLRYASGAGYMSRHDDSPADTFWEPVLKGPPSFSRHLFAPAATMGPPQSSYGAIQLTNADGALDHLRYYSFALRDVEILFGQDMREGFAGATPYADFAPFLSAQGEEIAFAWRDAVLRLRDAAAVLSLPFQTEKYRGDNAPSFATPVTGTPDTVVNERVFAEALFFDETGLTGTATDPSGTPLYAEYTQILPSDCTRFRAKLWGGGGGGGNNRTGGAALGGTGGAGGYCEVLLDVPAGSTLFIRIGPGRRGGSVALNSAAQSGGDTSIWLTDDSDPGNLLAMAGGGGGGGRAGGTSAGGAGGPGGGAEGVDGSGGTHGNGGKKGTQSAGGAGGTGGAGPDGNAGDGPAGEYTGGASPGSGGGNAGDGYYGGGSGEGVSLTSQGAGGGGGASGYADPGAVETTLTAGASTVPPNAADDDYDAGVGIGGAGSNGANDGGIGGPGKAVIRV